jgi:hypothetical protein
MTIGTARAEQAVAVSEPRALRIDPADNVAVAVGPVGAGVELNVEGTRIVAREDIGAGH